MTSQLDHDRALQIAQRIKDEQPDILATNEKGFFVYYGTKSFALYEACNRVASAWACGDRVSARDLKLVRAA